MQVHWKGWSGWVHVSAAWNETCVSHTTYRQALYQGRHRLGQAHLMGTCQLFRARLEVRFQRDMDVHSSTFGFIVGSEIRHILHTYIHTYIHTYVCCWGTVLPLQSPFPNTYKGTEGSKYIYEQTTHDNAYFIDKKKRKEQSASRISLHSCARTRQTLPS
jgi:hypothetical protein